MPLNWGFTGTRDGMTDAQDKKVRELINDLGGEEFHHGMDAGSDEQFHYIVLKKERGLITKLDFVFYEAGPRIIGHPPLNKKHAMKLDETIISTFFKIWPAKEYLDRNHDVVHESGLMLATPKEYDEVERGSGTWATIRYTIKMNKPLIVVWPDGRLYQNG